MPEEKQSPADTKDPVEIENQTQDRIIAAINHIKQTGSETVVLYGQGLGGFRAGHYLQESGNIGASTDNLLRGLIIADAQNEILFTPISTPDEKNKKSSLTKITDSFSNPDFPIFDIITDSSEDNIQKAKIRRNAARRQGLKKFRQRPIASRNDNTFLTQIYGFLKANCQ